MRQVAIAKAKEMQKQKQKPRARERVHSLTTQQALLFKQGTTLSQQQTTTKLGVSERSRLVEEFSTTQNSERREAFFFEQSLRPPTSPCG